MLELKSIIPKVREVIKPKKVESFTGERLVKGEAIQASLKENDHLRLEVELVQGKFFALDIVKTRMDVYGCTTVMPDGKHHTEVIALNNFQKDVALTFGRKEGSTYRYGGQATHVADNHFAVLLQLNGKVTVRETSKHGTHIKLSNPLTPAPLSETPQKSVAPAEAPKPKFEIPNVSQVLPRVAEALPKVLSPTQQAEVQQVMGTLKDIVQRGDDDMTSLGVANDGYKDEMGYQATESARYKAALQKFIEAYISRRGDKKTFDRRVEFVQDNEGHPKPKYPNMESKNDWDELAASLPDFQIRPGEQKEILAIFVIVKEENDVIGGYKIKSSIDHKQKGRADLVDAENGYKPIVKHGMLLMKKSGGFKTALFGGEIKMVVKRAKDGKLTYDIQDVNGESGGLKPRELPWKMWSVMRQLDKSGLKIPIRRKLEIVSKYIKKEAKAASAAAAVNNRGW